MKENSKIAVFSLAYEPFVGGAEIAVKEIIKRLSDFDFQIFTHDFRKYGHGKLAKFFYIFRAWRAAERSYKREPFGAIWAIMAAYGGLAALLFKLRHPRVPFLLTLQEGDSEEHILRRVGVFYFFWRKIFKKADYIQAISNYLSDFAKRHGAKCPIEVVPNGVNLERTEGQELKIKNQKQVIITTSRLVDKNGIDTLIKAFAKLPITNYQLLILGNGPEEKNLKNLAKDLKVENGVEFLGHIDPSQISEYLKKTDLFVRPSRSEGLGNSFLEAMAIGLPIIGTPVGGIPDFLIGYNADDADNMPMPRIGDHNGIFTRVDDPDDLANKIRFLLENKELSKKLGENGRKLVEKKYNWDIISKKMNGIFNKLTQ